MEEKSISVGLDIGTTKIVALVGRKNEFNKVEVLGVGKSKSLGVHRGVVNNITQTIQSIQQAVDDAKINSGHSISDVSVGIAGQHIRSFGAFKARVDRNQNTTCPMNAQSRNHPLPHIGRPNGHAVTFFNATSHQRTGRFMGGRLKLLKG